MASLLSSSFPRRLAAARAQSGLSVRAIGAAAGVSHQTVSVLEHGPHDPSLGTVERLAIALDVAPEWLAFGVGRAPSWWNG